MHARGGYRDIFLRASPAKAHISAIESHLRCRPLSARLSPLPPPWRQGPSEHGFARTFLVITGFTFPTNERSNSMPVSQELKQFISHLSAGEHVPLPDREDWHQHVSRISTPG